MITRYPADLPRLFSLSAFLCLMSYGFGGYFYEQAHGRPSSTSAIAVFFIPIWAIGAAVLGAIFGVIHRTVAGGPERRRPLFVAFLLLGAPLVLACLACMKVEEYERAAAPRVVITSPHVRREVGVVPPSKRTPSQLVWDDASRDVAGLPTLSSDNTWTLSIPHGPRTKPLDLAALDYVNFVHTVELREGPRPLGYASVITGRASGDRAVALLLSANLDILHFEILEADWRLDANPLATIDGEPVAFVGRPNAAISLRLIP